MKKLATKLQLTFKKNKSFHMSLLTILFLIISCSSSTSADDQNGDLNVMGVLVENTGSSDLTMTNVNVEFCYENEGCERSTINGNFTLPADAFTLMELGLSDPERTAVGVIASFQVTSGSGTLDVMRGYAEGEGLFFEFNAQESIHSESIGQGDSVELEVGEITD